MKITVLAATVLTASVVCSPLVSATEQPSVKNSAYKPSVQFDKKDVNRRIETQVLFSKASVKQTRLQSSPKKYLLNQQLPYRKGTSE